MPERVVRWFISPLKDTQQPYMTTAVAVFGGESVTSAPLWFCQGVIIEFVFFHSMPGKLQRFRLCLNRQFGGGRAQLLFNIYLRLMTVS